MQNEHLLQLKNISFCFRVLLWASFSPVLFCSEKIVVETSVM